MYQRRTTICFPDTKIWNVRREVLQRPLGHHDPVCHSAPSCGDNESAQPGSEADAVAESGIGPRAVAEDRRLNAGTGRQ